MPSSAIAVRTATVPAMGRGLFAARRGGFKRGDVVTYYAGRYVFACDADTGTDVDTDTTYRRSVLLKFLSIDGLREPVRGGGAGSFANDPLAKDARNARYVVDVDRHRVAIVATRAIADGDEVYVDYGAGYRRRHATPLVKVKERGVPSVKLSPKR